MLRHSGSGTRLEGAGPGVTHWGLSLFSGPSWTSASSCREPLEHDVCPETTKPGNMNCNQAKRYSQVFCGSNRMVIIIALRPLSVYLSDPIHQAPADSPSFPPRGLQGETSAFAFLSFCPLLRATLQVHYPEKTAC